MDETVHNHESGGGRLDRWLNTGKVSMLLLCVTFAVFSPLLAADFVQWDDNISVYQNPHVQGLDWERLRWMFTNADYAMRYKPLTWLSYALIYHCSGLKPFGYHLINLVFHCLNAVLVFLIIRHLLAVASGSSPGGAGPVAALENSSAVPSRQNRGGAERLRQATLPAATGALLWAINPLRVEPVARVTDLTYLLLLCFLLLSLWFYLQAWQAGEDTRSGTLLYVCSVAAFGLAMLAYPFASCWGIVLVVLDWYPLRRFDARAPRRRDPSARRVLLEKVPFLLWGGIAFTTLFARLDPTGIWTRAKVAPGLNLFERSMQAFYVWAYYLWKPWAPFHLSPVYTTLVDFNPDALRFWLSAALVLGTTALLFWKQRQWPWALALWIGHLALLLPALGLTERPHFTADRYDYLAGLVWAVALATILFGIRTRATLRAGAMAAALALAVVWGGLSLRQTPIWRNSGALFEYMIAELGNDPYRGDIQWRLGLFYAKQGKTDEAMRQYQTALRIQPEPITYQLLAELLQKQGHYQAALTNYLAALQLHPDPAVHAAAASLLADLGRTSEAIVHYRQALDLSPDLVPALNNLAWLLATDRQAENRNGAEAVRLAQRACTLTGYQAPIFLETLAAAYAEAGRFREAIEAGQAASDRAQATGQNELADQYGKVLKLYQAGKPYRTAGEAVK